MKAKLTLFSALGLIASLSIGSTAVYANHHPDHHHHHDGPKSHSQEHQHAQKGKMFMEADTNHDGVLNKKEFLKQAKNYFNAMDANSDNEVSQDEAKAHYRAKHKEMLEHHKALHNAKHEKTSHPAPHYSDCEESVSND